MSLANPAFSSIDEIEAATRSSGTDLRFVRLSTKPAHGAVRVARVGPMAVLRVETEGALHLLSGCDAETVVFGLPAGALAGARWRLADLEGDDLFTTPSARDFDLLTLGRAGFYLFVVPRHELADLSGDLDRWFPREGGWRSHLKLEPARARDLRELFECILQGPVDESRARELGTLLMQSILTAADRAGEPEQNEAGSRAHQADLARRYIEEHLTDSIKVEDIASAAGVGVRTLQRCFRETFGLTPLSYIKAQRLDRVRRDLLAAHSELQVSQAAVAHGLTHMGRFSQEYRRMFGELPRETLARARRSEESTSSHAEDRSAEISRPISWAGVRSEPDASSSQAASRVSGER